MVSKTSKKPDLAELTEREFDLRMRLEDLETKRSSESAEEQAHTAALYAQVKAALDAARKAQGQSDPV